MSTIVPFKRWWWDVYPAVAPELDRDSRIPQPHRDPSLALADMPQQTRRPAPALSVLGVGLVGAVFSNAPAVALAALLNWAQPGIALSTGFLGLSVTALIAWIPEKWSSRLLVSGLTLGAFCAFLLPRQPMSYQTHEALILGVVVALGCPLFVQLATRLMVGRFDLRYIGSASWPHFLAGIALVSLFVWIDLRQEVPDLARLSSWPALLAAASLTAAGFLGWFRAPVTTKPRGFRAVGYVVVLILFSSGFFGLAQVT